MPRNKKRDTVKSKIFKKGKSRSILIDEEIKNLKANCKKAQGTDLDFFKNFPITSKTKTGLQNGKYEVPTDIQKESILLALQGNDILGAAKTGSGKTIAFLIPVLECLYKVKWTQYDGLGALIISPTRELAYQIFEVLRVVGKFHDFSAGLVIGGKHLKEEAQRINKTNIVICTPGRLLQHMDETVNFNADNLQILVLDEADKILDMGFQESMNAIIQNLPVRRQTLLFSATQTKSVKDLARLSLKDPMYVSVHEKAEFSTPTQLQQSYIVCELHEKLNILWSFIKNHSKKKVLVFLSSCKQVRFVYEAFKRLRPDVTLLSLHGAMPQMKRVATYESFCRKENAVLFATDIASRGLDFPAVHWVIQLDCPEDANTYIHRVGRTARYEMDGESLLMLLPNEQPGIICLLNEKKIPINKIKINTKKMSSVQPKLESLCASEIQIKEFSQRAFVSYIKAVFFMKNKNIFDVTKLDTESFAKSYGLAIPPRIRFLQKAFDKKTQQQQKGSLKNSDSELTNVDTEQDSIMTRKASTVDVSSATSSSESDSDMESDSHSHVESDLEAKERNFKVKSKSGKDTDMSADLDFGDNELLVSKKKSTVIDMADDESDTKEEKGKEKVLTKTAIAKKILKKGITVNTKVKFNEEGEEVVNVLQKAADCEDDLFSIEEAKRRMQEADKVDKVLYRERIRKKKLEKKIKEKEKRRGLKQTSDEPVAMLGSAADNSNIESEVDSRLITHSASDNSDDDDAGSFNSEDLDRFNDNIESDEDTGNDFADDSESSDDNFQSQSRKRPRQAEQGMTKHKRKKTVDKSDNSLLADEELALKLLNY